MNQDALGRNNPCPVCWKQDPDRPMCYRGEPWCSDDCRKVVQGEVRPNPKQLTLMPQWLLDRLGIRFRKWSDDNEMPKPPDSWSWVYDAEEDSYYPSQVGPGQ